MKTTAVILAAGQGTRMKSNLPKVLHAIAGVPMITHVVNIAKQVTTETPVIVIGHGADAVRSIVGDDAIFVMQDQQLGTGHAVRQAESTLKGKTDLILVFYADMPLYRPETLKALIDAQKASGGAMSMLTVVADDPRGFGRIVRKADGSVAAIVEEAVANADQLKIKELNVGGYCFRADWLWQALARINVSPKGEYYLTDTVEIAVKDNLSVQAAIIEDRDEVIGINTRVHLAEAEAVMRKRINEAHMLNGVTIIDPAATYIQSGIAIGRDTIIQPNTHLQGETSIGAGCVIGPNTIIRNTKIGDRCKVLAADLESAILDNDVDMGPFVRLRKGAHLGDHVHMGNFGEVKDSHLRAGVKMGHFSYIGNADIGANTNIGAGTITCNYDGEKKHATTIGEDVFIGSDTMLVAPIKLGDGARTGAGSIVTKDVPDDTLVVGMPARAIKKLKRKG
jgi:bifunctional UDP-N-acetylglucosamine pyrophosphorylase/glucosamine-1-phosphate N-acetyltransferase